MNHAISIRVCREPEDLARFRAELMAYMRRDVQPDEDYFYTDEYRSDLERLRTREVDPAYFLFFEQDGRDVGFALAVVYAHEDGKQFILEFCVFPEYRGQGLGTACAEVLLDWGQEKGALYQELNAGTEARQRFWRRLGFLPNGTDRWSNPLMLRPPEIQGETTYERLSDPAELWELEDRYLLEIGEEPINEDEAKEAAVRDAMKAGRIAFFLARRFGRPIGICSVATAFSTFACGSVGTLEDLFVEPLFRHQGVARGLIEAAGAYCREHGVASLTVTCAPCDEAMYQSLGFDARLGATYAMLIE